MYNYIIWRHITTLYYMTWDWVFIPPYFILFTLIYKRFYYNNIFVGNKNQMLVIRVKEKVVNN